MKLLCVYDRWWPKEHPEIGEIYHVTRIYYREDGGIDAYDLQEFPCHYPYRWGAYYLGPGRRLCASFIPIEDEELSEITVDELLLEKTLIL